MKIRLAIVGVAALLVIFLIGFLIWNLFFKSSGQAEGSLAKQEGSGITAEGSVSFEDDSVIQINSTSSNEASTEEATQEAEESAEPAMPGFFQGYAVYPTEETVYISNPEVNSNYAVLVDLTDGHIVGQKNADTVISPASMTKIMTVLVAAEHISEDDLDNTVTMTREIADFVYQNESSAVNYAVDEVIPVRDLFFGTILPSGGDAALALANYVAGSEEAFVTMMNEKAEELGISSTAHFANPIGLYSEENHCTVTDMAIILKAAMENPISREALSTKRFTTTPTEQHPEGIEISNWFLRRIEDKDTHGEVLGAKTGFVVQSGNCAASCSLSGDGKYYICVTGQAHSAWRCIYDHVAIYQDYLTAAPESDASEGNSAVLKN